MVIINSFGRHCSVRFWTVKFYILFWPVVRLVSHEPIEQVWSNPYEVCRVVSHRLSEHSETGDDWRERESEPPRRCQNETDVKVECDDAIDEFTFMAAPPLPPPVAAHTLYVHLTTFFLNNGSGSLCIAPEPPYTFPHSCIFSWHPVSLCYYFRQL